MVYVWLAAGSLIIGMAALLVGIMQIRNLQLEDRNVHECRRTSVHILYISAFFIFLAIVFLLVNIAMTGDKEKNKGKKKNFKPYYTPGISRRVLVEPVTGPVTSAGGNSVRLAPGSTITISS